MFKKCWRPATGCFLCLWLLLLVGGRSRLFRDPGTFWHTVVGDQMISSGHLIYKDSFSFTFKDEKWIAHQWLGECIMALLHRIDGFDTLLLFTVTVLAALYTWIFQRLVRTGLHWLPAAMMVALAIGGSSSHFHIRPHIGTIAFLGLTYAFLCDFEAGRIGIRPMFWLVPVFLVWTSIHGGMLGGLCTMILALAGWAGASLIGLPSPIHKFKQIIPLTVLIVACGLTAFINPYGWRLPYTWIEIMDSPILPLIVREHAPLNPAKSEGWMVILLSVLYLVVFIGTLPRWPRVTWLLPVVWCYLGWSRVRHTPLFSITAIIALADMLPHTRWMAWLAQSGSDLFRFPEATSQRKPLDLRPALLPAAVVLLAFVLQIGRVPFPVVGSGWAQLDRTVWPVDMVADLKEAAGQQTGPVPIFDEDLFGGFLIYHRYFTKGFPDYLVFVDDRCELYGDNWLLDYVLSKTQNTGEYLHKWEKQYGRFDLALIQTESDLDAFFSQSKEWVPLRPPTKAATLYRRNMKSAVSRNDLHGAELAKVVIEGERLGDGKAFHNDLARAIGETPLPIGKFSKDFPCKTEVGFLKKIDLGQAPAKRIRSKANGPVALSARFEKGQRFIDHEVGCKERLCVPPEPLLSWGMINVVGDRQRVPGARINKNHRAPFGP